MRADLDVAHPLVPAPHLGSARLRVKRRRAGSLRVAMTPQSAPGLVGQRKTAHR